MERIIIAIILWLCACATVRAEGNPVVVGAERTEVYYPLLEGKRVAVFSNHTGVVGNRHLVDCLVADSINVVTIFSPEHGFRGTADAGEHVSGSIDPETGVRIRSLYDGKSGYPSAEAMRSFDVLLVDIQDVGLRFYTYYISMVKLMDKCAEYGHEVVVLDRPNPNGHYVDGPILDMKHKSGVGWLPIPVVHGMTLGELARMVNGERWLTGGRVCDLTVVPCLSYTHQTMYELPIPPSPNLPNMLSIYLYPSMCYFEATSVSLGRGTDAPFQLYGHPDMKGYTFSFIPRSRPGAKTPPQLGKRCYGVDLTRISLADARSQGICLDYLVDAYRNLSGDSRFFTSFFEKLIGVDYVRQMIVAGKSAAEIEAMWQEDVARFKIQRRPYLLYAE